MKAINQPRGSGTYALLKAALLIVVLTVCCLQSISQTIRQQEIEQSFQTQQPDIVPEKIYAHLSKTFYLPGEIIWFKIYLANPLNNTPSFLSKVAYVEILDSANKPILQAKLAIDSGSGSGSFVVPPYIATGNYLFRAYTNLSKNFSTNEYYHQSISLFNLSKVQPGLSATDTVQYHASFLPEGGNFVKGLPVNFGFKLQNQYGKGVAASGEIRNQRNERIVSFRTLRFGMGNFSFTPQAGDSYRVFINYPGNLLKVYELPKAEEEGTTLQLKENDSTIIIDIASNNIANNQYLYIFLHNKFKTIVSKAGKIQSGKSSFIFKKEDMPEGVSCFTLFNDSREAIAERLYFKKPRKNLHIRINNTLNNYKVREPVNMQIGVTEAGEFMSDLSMQVLLVDSLQPVSSTDIHHHLWLGSELKGDIEDLSYYFNSTDTETAAATHNLLLVHGWRKLVASPNRKNTIPEYAGHIITGKVIHRETGNPAPGIIAYLSVPGQRFHFSSCRSDVNGIIRFDVKKLSGTENIIVQTNQTTDSIYRIEIDNPFSDSYHPYFSVPLTVTPQQQNHLLNRITASQLENIFAEKNKQRFFLPDYYDSTSFFGKPDNSYLLDDYTRFTTMEEVMREYVSEVQVRKAGTAFRFRTLNLPYKLFFEANPLVLLDGVPVFDINKIIAFDPLKVRKLDIIARKYFQGGISFDGIASYNTYTGDLAGYQLDNSSLVIDYPGLQLQRQYYSPVYDTPEQKASRLPDRRNILYWNPDIRLKGPSSTDLSFYTSDIPGRYAVIVQGFSSTGNSGSIIQFIDVQ